MTWRIELLCVLLWSTHARAQAAEPDYEVLVRQGLEQYASGHWAEARIAFARAHGERPSARTLRGLGMVDFNLGAYARASAELEAALASPTLALRGTMREQAEDLLWRANRFVAHVRIQLRPTSAVLTVDGDMPYLDQQGDAILELGSHLVRAHGAGYRDAERTLLIELPVASVLSLELAREVKREEAPAIEFPPAAPSKLRPWAWLSTFTAVAALATGVAAYVVADHRYRELEQRCRAVCGPAPDGSDTVKRLDRTSQAMWAVGGASGLSASLLWTFERRDRRRSVRLATRSGLRGPE